LFNFPRSGPGRTGRWRREARVANREAFGGCSFGGTCPSPMLGTIYTCDESRGWQARLPEAFGSLRHRRGAHCSFLRGRDYPDELPCANFRSSSMLSLRQPGERCPVGNFPPRWVRQPLPCANRAIFRLTENAEKCCARFVPDDNWPGGTGLRSLSMEIEWQSIGWQATA